jgi:hypothetical protein
LDFKIPIEPNTPYVVQGWSELADYPTLFVGVHQLDESLTFLNDSSWKQITGTGYSFTSLSNAAYVRVTFREQTYSAAGAAAVVSAIGDSVRIKLEKGNKATDWSPAPEDVDSAVDDASKVATNYIIADETGLMIAKLTNNAENYTSSTIPTGNRNVFIDSDSLDIRDGQNVLASFGENTVIGAKGDSRIELSSDNIFGYHKDHGEFFKFSGNGYSTVVQSHS